MTKEILPNGLIRLTNTSGIIDTRNNRKYSEFIGPAREERFFIDAPQDE